MMYQTCIVVWRRGSSTGYEIDRGVSDSRSSHFLQSRLPVSTLAKPTLEAKATSISGEPLSRITCPGEQCFQLGVRSAIYNLGSPEPASTREDYYLKFPHNHRCLSSKVELQGKRTTQRHPCSALSSATPGQICSGFLGKLAVWESAALRHTATTFGETKKTFATSSKFILALEIKSKASQSTPLRRMSPMVSQDQSISVAQRRR